MSDRPTFDYNGKPVRAAGLLIWTKYNGCIHRLFRKIEGKFEDIGGKTDLKDKSYKDTMIREVCEETHGKLFSENHTTEDCAKILQELVEKSWPEDIEYNPLSKYILYKLEVHPNILNQNMKRFGLSEKTDWGTLKHYYQWRWKLPYHNQLHYRLRGMRL